MKWATQTKPDEPLSMVKSLLGCRAVRVLLLAAPGITSAVAILTSTESNLAVVIALNAAAGVIVSSMLFLAVSVVAHQVASERAGLAQAAEAGAWRARLQLMAIQHEESGLYTEWYLRLRVEEEIDRARRYSAPFVVLLLKPMGLHYEAELPAAAGWFGEQLRRHLRRSDLPAILRDGELAVLMPCTGRRAALAVRRRIAAELAQVEAVVGMACFPGEGDNVEQLLAAAHRSTMHQRRAG